MMNSELGIECVLTGWFLHGAVYKKPAGGGRVLKEQIIQQRTKEHPVFGCSFAYVVPERNAPEWCV